ncbi:MAG TPA: GNAT family N-acetyltransferase [Streptosporangiaceae bacterium]|nr:GNAT family N-acetyltransferase [Streptosporangiaceae bacterium]
MSNQASPQAAIRQSWTPGAGRAGTAAHPVGEPLGRLAPGQALPGELLLRDGTPAMIWPLLPTDAEMLREGFRRLSEDSRQYRFLMALTELSEPMIQLLVDSVDGVHHIALVLVVLPPDGEEGPVGVAHLLQDPADPASADIAVTVIDDWQGHGAGSALVAALMQQRPAEVTRLRTLVAADNRASLALLAGAGRVSSGLPALGVLDVTVELPAAPRTPTAAETASLIPAVERYLKLIRQVAELNRALTVQWVETASALSGELWRQILVEPVTARRGTVAGAGGMQHARSEN